MTKLILQVRAKSLREDGNSIKQISHELGVSSSSVSTWVKSVKINSNGLSRINTRVCEARARASHVLHERKILRVKASSMKAASLSKNLLLSTGMKYMLAALIYECEGGKSEKSSLEFTNSDPDLVRIFLRLLRESVSLDESKFRVVMHLHSYHDEAVEKNFWSKIIQIDKKQFLKTYQKHESGNAKPGYRGCVQIKYFDVNIKRVLLEGKKILAIKL